MPAVMVRLPLHIIGPAKVNVVSALLIVRLLYVVEVILVAVVAPVYATVEPDGVKVPPLITSGVPVPDNVIVWLAPSSVPLLIVTTLEQAKSLANRHVPPIPLNVIGKPRICDAPAVVMVCVPEVAAKVVAPEPTNRVILEEIVRLP